MAFFEDALKGGNLLTGIGVVVGLAVAGPILRPLAKSLLKTGLLAYDQGRAALSGLNEATGDLVTEARSEMAQTGDTTATGSSQQPAPRRPRRGPESEPSPA